MANVYRGRNKNLNFTFFLMIKIRVDMLHEMAISRSSRINYNYYIYVASSFNHSLSTVGYIALTGLLRKINGEGTYFKTSQHFLCQTKTSRHFLEWETNVDETGMLTTTTGHSIIVRRARDQIPNRKQHVLSLLATIQMNTGMAPCSMFYDHFFTTPFY